MELSNDKQLLSEKIMELLEKLELPQLVRIGDISLVIERDIRDCYGVDFPEHYVVQLDNRTNGFIATKDKDGVNCECGWVATEKNLELINEVALKPNKWYHTTDFTVDELQELLPSGTKVEVEAEVLYNDIDTTPPTKTKQATVKKVVSSAFKEKVFIETVNDNFYKEWFKIIQED